VCVRGVVYRKEIQLGYEWLLRGLDELTKLGVPLRYDGLILGGAGQGCMGDVGFLTWI
jgi:hypothetical protein